MWARIVYAYNQPFEAAGVAVSPREVPVTRSACSLLPSSIFCLAVSCVPSWILISPALLSAQAAQTATKDENDFPVVKVDARTVVVDVVVTDKNGKPVQGLHKSDFQLAEDGHGQKSVSFEEHTGMRSAPVDLPALPPNIFLNVPRVKPADAVTVLLLDSLNTPFADQNNVRTQILKYLKKPQPGMRMAIFGLGARLHLIQGFSDNPELLAKVLNSVKRGAGPQASDLLQTKGEIDLSESSTNELLAMAGPQDYAQVLAEANAITQFWSEQTASQTDVRVLATLNAFQQMATYLAAVPGRKNVVWFSSSFPVGIFADPAINDGFSVQREYAEAVRKTDAMLTAAQVAIYPVAAEGLTNDQLFDADQHTQNVNTQQQLQQQQMVNVQTNFSKRSTDHLNMDQIAKDTGAQAFVNTNGLAEALARVVEIGSNYYTLSYIPSNPSTDGKFRKIQVKLSERNMRLSYRRGYFALDEKEARRAASKPAADPLSAYMVPGLPDSTQIAVALRVQETVDQPLTVAGAPTSRAGGNTKLSGPVKRYGVEFVVAAHSLELDASSDGMHHGKIEAGLVAFDREGQPLNWTEREFDLNLDAAHYRDAQENGLHFRLDLDVPKEGISLRSGVYDLKASTAGTYEVQLMRVMNARQTASLKVK
jgi:VWFA-related protein